MWIKTTGNMVSDTRLFYLAFSHLICFGAPLADGYAIITRVHRDNHDVQLLHEKLHLKRI